MVNNWKSINALIANQMEYHLKSLHLQSNGTPPPPMQITNPKRKFNNLDTAEEALLH